MNKSVNTPLLPSKIIYAKASGTPAKLEVIFDSIKSLSLTLGVNRVIQYAQKSPTMIPIRLEVKEISKLFLIACM
ncbi:hypothetical protein D3C71_1938470 [compost metagenome]